MPKVQGDDITSQTPPAVQSKQVRLAHKLAKIRSFRINETLSAAKQSGLIGAGKEDRISARVSHELLEQAKSRTGISGTSELLEFALASVALEDHFEETMTRLEGTVDKDIKLGF
ncbi:hypothetical protein [Ochrobactrum sp. BTU1]|uniref:hypothetical protein n=1 Tax=Ochrobactrum sp. BTU1 TaxID=2840456 RepID=UPI00207B83AB